jgi:hypothetical protein
LSSKQVESHPYVVIEDKCIEQATIKSIGKVLNNLTFLNTIMDNNIMYLAFIIRNLFFKMI